MSRTTTRMILVKPFLSKQIDLGNKTVTRRIITPQPNPLHGVTIEAGCLDERYGFFDEDGKNYYCPHGVPGDLLKIREVHYLYGFWEEDGKTKTGKDAWKFKRLSTSVRYSDNPPDMVCQNGYRKPGWYKRNPLFMFAVDARKTIELVDISVERLRDISMQDAVNEGIELLGHNIGGLDVYKNYLGEFPYSGQCNARESFFSLWDSMHGGSKFDVDANPYVWVERVRKVK